MGADSRCRPSSTASTSQPSPSFRAVSTAGPSWRRPRGPRRPGRSPRRWSRRRPHRPTADHRPSRRPGRVCAASHAQPALRRLAVHQAQVAIGQQHPGGAVDRVFLVGKMLVAEPERDPTAVGPLLAGQIGQPALDGLAGDVPLGNPLAARRARARRAWAVRSQPLRSKGSLPQPRQKVGQPPSAFCSPGAKATPGRGGRFDPPAVVLAAGVQQAPSGPAGRRRCRRRRARRRRRRSSPSRPAAAG